MTTHRSEHCCVKRLIPIAHVRVWDTGLLDWTSVFVVGHQSSGHYVRIHIVMEEPPALHIQTLIKNTVWLLMKNDEVKIT